MNSITKYFSNEQPQQFSFEQMELANKTIENYFENNPLPGIRDDLQNWYKAAILSNYPPYQSGEERSNLYTQLEQFMEAAYILHTAKTTIEQS